MSITESEAQAIAVRAVELALARLPLPSAVTLTEAARMLNICRDTARKLNLPRNCAAPRRAIGHRALPLPRNDHGAGGRSLPGWSISAEDGRWPGAPSSAARAGVAHSRARLSRRSQSSTGA